MRKKTTTIKIDEEKLEKFNKIIAAFTKTTTIEYPSRTIKIYNTKFPDSPFSYNKYTIADLLDKALKEFIKKYETYV